MRCQLIRVLSNSKLIKNILLMTIIVSTVQQISISICLEANINLLRGGDEKLCA